VTFDGSHSCKDIGATTLPLILDIYHESSIPPVYCLGKVFCLKFGVISDILRLNQGLLKVIAKSLFHLGIGEIRVFTEIPLWLNLRFAEHLIVHHDISGEYGESLQFL
jgi:hypothetical protein